VLLASGRRVDRVTFDSDSYVAVEVAGQPLVASDELIGATSTACVINRYRANPGPIIACPMCREWFSPASFFPCCRTLWPEHDLAVFVCPRCQKESALQLWPGEVRFGYTYAAGEMHFATVFTYQVPGLLRDAAIDHFALELNSDRWSIPKV
jgi:hypothetical protein